MAPGLKRTVLLSTCHWCKLTWSCLVHVVQLDILVDKKNPKKLLPVLFCFFVHQGTAQLESDPLQEFIMCSIYWQLTEFKRPVEKGRAAGLWKMWSDWLKLSQIIKKNKKTKRMRAESSLKGNGAVHFRKTLKSITGFASLGELKLAPGLR